MRRHAQNHRAGSARLAVLARDYLKQYTNSSVDPEKNGEYAILELLSEFRLKTVFDVGANNGDYEVVVLEKFPEATIHGFEMDAEVFDRLQRQHPPGGRVTNHNFGLSDGPGEHSYYFNEAGPNTGSTMFYDPYVRPNNYTHQKRTAYFLTGDLFCADQGIEKVDFLKIDTEGADFSVIKGFEKMLDRGLVSALQFEYNFHAFNARVFLYDFYKYLEPKGYAVGRLYPRGAFFAPYNLQHEGRTGIFIAVHRSASEMQDRLHYEPPLAL